METRRSACQVAAESQAPCRDLRTCLAWPERLKTYEHNRHDYVRVRIAAGRRSASGDSRPCRPAPTSPRYSACLRTAATGRTRQASSSGRGLRRRPTKAAKGPPRDALKPVASAGGDPRQGTLCVSKRNSLQRRGGTEATSFQSTKAEGRRRQI